MLLKGKYGKSLFFTVGFSVALTVVIIMSLHAAFTYFSTKQQIVREMENNTKASIVFLEKNVANFIESYNVNEYENLIRTELERRKSFAIVVEDFNLGRIMGKPAYVSGKIRDEDRHIIEFDPENDLHQTQLKECFYSEQKEVRSKSGKLLGNITVCNSDEVLVEKMNFIIRSTLINTSILIVVHIISLFIVMQRVLLAPLSRIIAAITDRDRAGIPIHPIPDFDTNEMVLLSRTMNSMIKSIRLSQKELKELNETLESRIESKLRELREKDEMLIIQSKNAALGEMINNIAHQWRQPITSIGLLVQNLEDRYDDNNLTKEYLSDAVDRAMVQIEYMSQTINDFRNFFQSTKQKHNFSTRKSLKSIMSLASPQLQAHGIRVEFVGDDIEMYGLENEFKQVILNVIMNSKDAIIERKKVEEMGEGRVRISVSQNQDDVFISISDNGGGIPPDLMDRIFEPYFTTKFKNQGTGIGLYMTQTIVEKHMKGKIMVHNVDEGAEFNIRIPLNSDDSSKKFDESKTETG